MSAPGGERTRPRAPGASSRRFPGVFVLGLLALGCGGGALNEPDLGPASFDLVARLATATFHTEPSVLDLGTSQARRSLLRGWSWNEAPSADGTTLVWSDGPESAVEFFLVAVRPWRLRLRCVPLRFDGSPGQRVQVDVNGYSVGEVALEPSGEGIGEHEVLLPEERLRLGRNVLVFRYAFTAVPRDVLGTRDRRRLAVAWDALVFHPASTPRSASSLAFAPRGLSDPSRLLIPFGYQVDYYLEPGAASRFRLEGVDFEGQGRLRVFLDRDGGPERELLSLGSFSHRRDVDLPAAESPGPVRLTLRSVAGSGDGGHVTLTRPRVDGWSGQRSVPLPPRTRPRPQRRPHVVIYLVDTLRADRLGCYGAHTTVSPNIDALAREGIVFEDVVAQSSWTRPSVASILTGLGPLDHGVNTLRRGLSEETRTLAEHLRSAGYRTAAFSTNRHITEEFGFAQGFDFFQLLELDHDLSPQVNESVMSWLADQSTTKPFFLYIHTIDPHAPYSPPAEFRRRWAADVMDVGVGSVESLRALSSKKRQITPALIRDLVSLYDAEIAYNDHSLGLLREALAERLGENTVLVFLSDHGEGFYEHRVVGHGWDLYAEALRIPFILKLPDGPRGRRVTEPVQQIDVVPTLLDYLGLSPPPLPGRSLLPLLERGLSSEAPGPRSLLSYMSYEGREGVSLIRGEWKLIEPLAGGFAPGPELYRRTTDPGEERNLASRYPVMTGYLGSLIRGELFHAASGHRAPSVEMTEETRQRLRALGYVN